IDRVRRVDHLRGRDDPCGREREAPVLPVDVTHVGAIHNDAAVVARRGRVRLDCVLSSVRNQATDVPPSSPAAAAAGGASWIVFVCPFATRPPTFTPPAPLPLPPLTRGHVLPEAFPIGTP